MAIIEQDLQKAEMQMDNVRISGFAVDARFEPSNAQIVVTLNTGVQICFPKSLFEEFGAATDNELENIEITPAGLGLHWPELDVDFYLPSLLQGVFGTKTWMASQLGAVGGKARSPAKTTAARENGRKGGRPRKVATT